MTRWFVTDKGLRTGPFATEVLAANIAAQEVSEAALVWKEGLPGWQPANIHFAVLPPVPAYPEPADPAHRTPTGGAVVRYWQGRYSLAVSFWIVGLLGLLLILFSLSLYAIIIDRQGFNPYVALAVIVPVWVVTGVFAVFQLVGTWRAAARYAEEGGHGAKSALVVWVAQTAAVGGLIAFGILLSKSGIDQIAEGWRIAFQNDPDISAYSLRLMRNDTELEIAGGFKYGLAREVEQSLREHKQVKVLHLNSGGGRLGEALKIVKLIRSRGLITYTASECSSACTVAFAAGKERLLKNGAVLGYHASSFAGKDSASGMSSALIEVGVNKTFATRAGETSSDDIWYPEFKELLSNGIISGEVDDYRFAASGFGASSEIDKGIAESLLSSVTFQVMKKSSPALFEKATKDTRSAYLSGISEGKLEETERSYGIPFLQARLSVADNGKLAAYAESLADEFDVLGHAGGSYCFDYAVRGLNAEIDYEVPYTISDRRDAVLEEILQSPGGSGVGAHPDLEAIYQKLYSKVAVQHGLPALDLLRSPERAEESQHDLYCHLATTLAREVALLPPAEAGVVMKDVLMRHLVGARFVP